VKCGYAICARQVDRWQKFGPTLQFEVDHPINRIHNLITELGEPVAAFKLIYGVNLLLVELEARLSVHTMPLPPGRGTLRWIITTQEQKTARNQLALFLLSLLLTF